MNLGLQGRVAVITGPAKGMGAAVTRAFAAEGCRLALLGRDTAAIAPVAEAVGGALRHRLRPDRCRGLRGGGAAGAGGLRAASTSW